MSNRITPKNAQLPLKLMRGYITSDSKKVPVNKRILSMNHPSVNHWRFLTDDKRYRYKNNEIILPGMKLMAELSEHLEFKHVITTTNQVDLSSFRFDPQCISRVSNRIIERITGIKSFDGGIAGVVSIPPQTHDFGDPRLVLVLDHINDPGHLGTILRTALALQWHAVLILPNCVDPFHPIALRASQGALFHLPYQFSTWKETQEFAKQHRLALASVHHQGESVDTTNLFDSLNSRGVCLLVREETSSTPSPGIKLKKLWMEDIPAFEASENLSGSEPYLPLLETPTRAAIMMDLIRSKHFSHVSRSSFTTSPDVIKR